MLQFGFNTRQWLMGALLAAAASQNAVAQSGAEGPNHPVEPLSHEDLLHGLQSRALKLNDVRRMGLDVFTTPFNTLDGMGDGPYDPAEIDPLAFGQRPSLQGNGLILRINGLDAQSCNECHTIVSAATRPPELGIGGVGGMVQNAIIMPTVMDVADSSDGRIQYLPGFNPDMSMTIDGTADFNGRFSNPPFLFGGGGVELLAKEMTADLQALLAEARLAPAGSVTELDTHDVNFGRIHSLGGGEVSLELEGIGFESAGARSPEEQLVVRPFGRKGENFSMRDFDRGAMQFHFGIEPVEVVGADHDGDGDGVVNEITVGELTALHVFDVTNPPPRMNRLDPGARQGLAHFMDFGCGQCHRPLLRTRGASLGLAFPEIPEDPSANVYLQVDLRKVGFERVRGGGLRVPLFADLKRHRMGPRLAESFGQGEIANDEFTTARLWGVADTAPYLHDGRATTLFDAIELHGGEAQLARDAFMAASTDDQHKLIRFLKRLRTPTAPNAELLRGRDDDDDD